MGSTRRPLNGVSLTLNLIGFTWCGRRLFGAIIFTALIPILEENNVSSLGMVHVVFASTALLMGALVLLLKKGTRLHRTTGHLYFTSMLGLNLSGLFIFNLYGRFGPFHIMAIFSLATLLSGMVPVIVRRPRGGWLELHARFMSWSYVGLLAAAVSEGTTRIPDWPFAAAVIIPSAFVVAVGGVLIQKRMRTAFGQLPARVRRQGLAGQ